MKKLCMLLTICASSCASQEQTESQHAVKVEELRAAHIARLGAAQSLEEFEEFETERRRFFDYSLDFHDPRREAYQQIDSYAMRREWYCRTHTDLSPQTAKAIICGELLIGMTPEQVRASWGQPTKVNQTMTSEGLREQWVYASTRYAYFREGVLAAWQARSQ